MKAALVVGAFFAALLVLPATLWLTKLIRPSKPEQEAMHRHVDEARHMVRRRLDDLR